MREDFIYYLKKEAFTDPNFILITADLGFGIFDDFENLYKGEISKSGTPILPSKRARKIPEKIQVSKEDIEELTETKDTSVPSDNEEQTEDTDVSLDELSETESEDTDSSSEDPNASNS